MAEFSAAAAMPEAGGADLSGGRMDSEATPGATAWGGPVEDSDQIACPPPKLIAPGEVPNIVAEDRISVEDKSAGRTGPDCKAIGSAAADQSTDGRQVAATADTSRAIGATAATSQPSRLSYEGQLQYSLPGGVPLVLQRGDITKWFVDSRTDAIVNAANEVMLGGGGVDGAIHRAAGPRLYDACKQVPMTPRGRCPTGEARITGGFDLPAAFVIHTVGPVFSSNEESAPLLASAYRSSMEQAKKNGIKYICFPAISCGVYGYPYDEAARVALQAISEAAEGLSEVHFVLFGKDTWKAWRLAADELQLPTGDGQEGATS